MPAKTRAARRGFTMIEMLVALVATLLMVMFLDQIFAKTSNAVSRGAGLSEILQQVRTVTSQIDSDASEMVGPSAGGLLIIDVPSSTNGADANGLEFPQVDNKTLNSGEIAPNTAAPSPPKTPPYGFPWYIYDDQIEFIRFRGTIEPLTPIGNSGTQKSTAAYCRVWYGHCLRTKTDGSDTGNDLANAADVNQFPVNWVLGRQALFLDPNAGATNNYANDGIVTHAAYYNAAVNLNYFANTPSQGKVLYAGCTDVAKVDLASLNAGLRGLNPATMTADSSYQVDVKQMLFSGPDATTPTARLRCNPAPDTGSAITDVQIAQVHPVLAVGVSDFKVEWATAAGAAASPITWVHTAGVNAWNSVDSTKANWPVLIRISYRIHDRSGEVTGPDGNAGILIEKIIRVPQ